MLQYQRVLFASDLSLASENVGEKAAAIAQNSGSQLHMVHALHDESPMAAGGEIALPAGDMLEDERIANCEAEFLAQAQRLGVAAANQYFVEGSVRQVIVDLVNDKGIDLIVVGSHDRHGVGLLFPSTGDAIFHAMPCDILAIKIEGKPKRG